MVFHRDCFSFSDMRVFSGLPVSSAQQPLLQHCDCVRPLGGVTCMLLGAPKSSIDFSVLQAPEVDRAFPACLYQQSGTAA